MVSIDKSKIYVFDDIIPSSTQDVLEDKIGRLHFRYAINHHQKPFTIKVKNDPKIWNQNRHGLLQSYQFPNSQSLQFYAHLLCLVLSSRCLELLL